MSGTWWAGEPYSADLTVSVTTELLAADLELRGVIPLFSCGPLVLALAAWIGIFWVRDQQGRGSQLLRLASSLQMLCSLQGHTPTTCCIRLLRHYPLGEIRKY